MSFLPPHNTTEPRHPAPRMDARDRDDECDIFRQPHRRDWRTDIAMLPVSKQRQRFLKRTAETRA